MISNVEQTLPTQASVVVIGGGAMGCSTLYHLASLGVTDALLLERNQLTSGTTWHSAAQVRALRSSRNMTDLIRYSIDLYQRLEQETGQATGWINKGSLSIATTPDRLIHVQRQLALAQLFDVPAESVTPGEAKERWPLMRVDDVIGAVWSPGDGRVGPTDLCAALVKGARARGARIAEQTEVVGIETDAGRIRAVQTSRGRVQCDAVVLCTGLWSREAGALAGATVPVWPCEHYYLLTQPMPQVQGNLPTLSDHDAHLYIRDDSGGLLVGCFEPAAKSIDPARIGKDFAFQLLAEDWDHFEPMMVGAMHRVPALEQASVKTLLNGPESFTPDGTFILGETAQTRGLFLGCGMNSVGIATAGGAGMALAHCVVHGHAPLDLHEVAPDRFNECFNRADALAARVPEVLGKHYEISYPNRQWRSARQLRALPLAARWRALDAWSGQYDGWERPLYFGATRAPRQTFGRPDWFEKVQTEVQAVHLGSGLFDQSSLGKIDVSGPDAAAFLDGVCSNNMQRAPGRATYTTVLNERGGIVSDMTVLRLSDDHYRLYTGTASIRHDIGWLRRFADGMRVAIRDVTTDYAVIALMGPDSPNVLQRAGADALNAVPYFGVTAHEIAGVPVQAARLTYVGEAGMELTCPAGRADDLYQALTGAGAGVAGLFAQTSMRIEKRYLAYGHDMDSATSPLQAGLEFAVHWDNPFHGRDALLRRRDAGERCRLVTLVFDEKQAVPIGDEPVRLGETIIGKTTSAAFGFRIDAPLALAELNDGTQLDDGQAVQVQLGVQRFQARAYNRAVFDPVNQRIRQAIRD